jgi:hypothetical protein
MNAATEFIIVIAALVAITVGGIYIYEHVNAGCINFIFFKSCGAVIH